MGGEREEGGGSSQYVSWFQVFAGNTDACTKVTSQQIHRVVTLAAQHRDHAPQLLDLLASVVKVQELQLPVKRNQGLVMTYFLQYRSDLAAILDQPPDVRSDAQSNGCLRNGLRADIFSVLTPRPRLLQISLQFCFLFIFLFVCFLFV